MWFLISTAVGGTLLHCTAPPGSALSPRLPSPPDPALWKPLLAPTAQQKLVASSALALDQVSTASTPLPVWVAGQEGRASFSELCPGCCGSAQLPWHPGSRAILLLWAPPGPSCVLALGVQRPRWCFSARAQHCPSPPLEQILCSCSFSRYSAAPGNALDVFHGEREGERLEHAHGSCPPFLLARWAPLWLRSSHCLSLHPAAAFEMPQGPWQSLSPPPPCRRTSGNHRELLLLPAPSVPPS